MHWTLKLREGGALLYPARFVRPLVLTSYMSFESPTDSPPFIILSSTGRKGVGLKIHTVGAKASLFQQHNPRARHGQAMHQCEKPPGDGPEVFLYSTQPCRAGRESSCGATTAQSKKHCRTPLQQVRYVDSPWCAFSTWPPSKAQLDNTCVPEPPHESTIDSLHV